ncbi:hypothetical protein HNR23_000775 [Nocardiopsis mwathae]|uniref:DUF397 domain-containing protein n=1 Tax=Nocardiopsis mwathae TaxID=1472723 RepID=A0A7W9YF02_9ACTN|nr:DUF397 domain-containing protein [Nocardiopsis mwathae]MBB6170715.1 hypothetical protein [Nocardiopsis mwathae]
MSDRLPFRKSSYSGSGNNCVEVATVPRGAAVRDSKSPENGYLMFGVNAWHSFLEDVKADQL